MKPTLFSKLFLLLMKFAFPCDANFSLLYYPGQGNTECEPDPLRNSALRSFSFQEKCVFYYLNGSWRWFCLGKSSRRPKQEVALEICVIFCWLRRMLLTFQWQTLTRLDEDLVAQQPESVGPSIRTFSSN